MSDCKHCGRPIKIISGKSGPKPQFHPPCAEEHRNAVKARRYHEKRGIDPSSRRCLQCGLPISPDVHLSAAYHPECAVARRRERQKLRNRVARQSRKVRECMGCGVSFECSGDSVRVFHTECAKVRRMWTRLQQADRMWERIYKRREPEAAE